MSNKYIVMVLLLLLIPAYVVGVYSLPPTTSNTCEDKGGGGASVGGDKVGFCTEISVSVMRPYYFGLLRLPVHRLGMSFDLAHRLFVPVTLALVGLVWWRFD